MKTTHPLSLAKLKYARHKAQAKFRNIDFNFDFDTWYQWWLSNGIDKNIKVKWNGAYRPCMCRIGDTGPYDINNVYLANHIENVSDAIKNKKNNPRGARTDKNYRYGDKLYSLYELKDLNVIDIKDRGYYRVETYDQKNIKETLRLINRYNKYLDHKTKKMWETPAGMFDNIADAVKSVNVSRNIFLYRVDKGIYKKHIIRLVPTLKEYIIQNSRYPDPYMPNDIGDNL